VNVNVTNLGGKVRFVLQYASSWLFSTEFLQHPTHQHWWAKYRDVCTMVVDATRGIYNHCVGRCWRNRCKNIRCWWRVVKIRMKKKYSLTFHFISFQIVCEFFFVCLRVSGFYGEKINKPENIYRVWKIFWHCQ